MRYAPRPITDEANLISFLTEELRRISDSMSEVDGILLPEKNVAPTKPRDGMIILADGVNFNPGNGKGFYGRHLGVWFPLGSEGGQLPFPATQNPSSGANVLDDYEEGTFTPTIIGSTGGTATTSTATGLILKVGQLVWAQLRVTASSVAGLTGNIQIGGLPYSSHATNAGRIGVKLSDVTNVTGHNLGTTLGTYLGNSSTIINLADNTAVAIGVGALTAPSSFDLTVVYRANAKERCAPGQAAAG